MKTTKPVSSRWSSFFLLIATLAVFLPASLVSTASAATIYSDSFSGSGASALHGQAPTTRPGTETWIAHSRWMADGTTLPPVGNNPANAFLPFTPVAGLRYTLSADVNATAGAGDWMALGFSASTSTNTIFQNAPNNPVGWMLLRNTRGAGQGQSFLGTGTSGGVAYDSPAGVVNLKIILDTTRPMWTVQYFVNGTAVRGPLQFSASNPSILYVAMGAYNTTAGTVDNLTLTSDADTTTLFVNPSFENNNFTVRPGTVSGNTAINGWSVLDTAKAGLNPAGGANDVAQNGAVPHGTNVVWLQNPNILSTVLNGLTPGTTYTVSFRANSRTATGNTNAPVLRVATDNTPGLFDAGGVVAVGGANPYYFVSLNFAATAGSHTLYITNNQSATNYLLLDNFNINVSTSGWSYARWTNDASAGVDSTKNYTHAYAFATASSPVISNVTFRGISGVNPNVPNELFTSGLVSGPTADAANVLKTAGGGSGTLASQMVYGGNPAIFGLQGLVPGMQYVVTFYGVAWDVKAYGRSVTWMTGSDRMTINEDQFDNDVGIRISYVYTAPASGVMWFTNVPFSTAVGTFHTYGLANYEAVTQTTPVIGVNPQSVTAIPGSMVTLGGIAGGARPLSYRWLSNGVEVVGQTNRFLILTNVDASFVGVQYSLWVSNAFGMATSTVAGVTLDTATYTIVNPSFEADTFYLQPGTIAANQLISGWTASYNNNAGLNPAAGYSAYATTGVPPDGSQVAFLSGGTNLSGLGTNVLSTLLSGLTVGQNYTLGFRVNGNGAPSLRASIDGAPIGGMDSIASVGGINPYWYLAFNFTATNTTQTLGLTNSTLSAAANYLLLDDFHLSVSNSAWSYTIWTNDASSGVDGTKVYTHAYNFNSSAGTTINGVFFNSAGAGQVPGRAGTFGAYSTTGFPSGFANDPNTMTTNGGGSAVLANDFRYGSGGVPQTITLSNLVPNVQYVTTIYGCGFDNLPAARAVTFTVGSDRMTIDEDQYGNNNGIRVSYAYYAPTSGTMTITYVPVGANSFHTYGFSNYELSSTNLPTFYAKPSQVPNWLAYGGSLTFTNFVIGGQQPLALQWQLNGTNLVDQTNAWLSISNAGDASAGTYTLVASNAQGVVTQNYVVNVGFITNPSFEADVFPGFPGYISGNSLVTGWTTDSATRSGLNPANGSPFADNGVIPDGSQVAFLQSTSSLRTVIGGLISNTTYTVNFRINSRNGQKPNLHVGMDGYPILDMVVSSVGGTNNYKYVAIDFLATNSTQTLSLTNNIAGDHTAVIDDFRVNVSTSKWSYAAWTSDATAGIDTTKLYTHAYRFGNGAADTTINGVKFVGVPNANPSVAGSFGTVGLISSFGPHANNLTTGSDGSAALAAGFVYGGASQSIILSNLYPGMEYVATIYGVAFDASYRSATFAAGSDRRTINENILGLGNGIAVSYRYVAGPDGTMTLTYVATDSATTFHTYGFANRVANDSLPIIGVQPPSQAYIARTETLNLSVGLSAGTLPIYYQWQLNGADLPGQNGSKLVISGASVGTNLYQVVMTNSMGAVTSSVATVVVGEPFTELYNTGVTDTKAPADGGTADLHYQLISSGDSNYPGPAAIILYDIWPATNGVYMVNGPISKWISPMTNSSVGNLAGLYTYRTTFILDTQDPATAQIRGKTAVDNNVLDILLNGVSLGISNNAGFASFTPFTINGGFLAGSNTLELVTSNGPASGPTALRVEMDAAAMPLVGVVPHLATSPVDATVIELQDVTLTSLAIGSPPLAYQWYKEGFPLPGATNRLYQLPHVAGESEASYTLVVTNASGAVTSAPAYLTVLVRPTIDVGGDPVSITVPRGNDATFAVSAYSTIDMTYQWYWGTNLLAGATNASLVITNVMPNVRGDYQVVVANVAGSITSAVAVLTVPNTAPVAPVFGFSISQNSTGVVQVAKLLAGATDAENDPVSLVNVSATSTNGGSVAIVGTNLVYTPLPGFTGEDRFSYTVTDGYDSTTSVVVAFVVSGPLPLTNMISIVPVGAGFHLRFAGIPGRTYEIQRATAVNGPWVTVDTQVAPPYGIIDYEDATPPPGLAFYRLVSP